jgi:DNA-binding IscR family transcriptional regulator
MTVQLEAIDRTVEERPTLTTNDCLFGNLVLQEEMRGAAQVLVMIAEHAPRPVRIEELCSATGRCERDVAKLCRVLEQGGLMSKPSARQRVWTLTCDANLLTLADVYLCIVDDLAREADRAAAPEAPEKSLRRLDVLLTQAAMTVHQSVLTHLRQFSIGTVRRRQSFDGREASLRTRWESFSPSIAF